MTRRRSVIMVLALVGAVVVAAGCHSAPFAGRDTLPYPAVDDRSTSLAFNSRYLEAMESVAGMNGQLAEIPWYLYRNDLPLSTEAGYSSPAYEQSFNYTYDAQVQTNSRVHNYFNSTTYRTRYVQRVGE